ncbi:MAG: ABC transporter ATP-binding protein [Hyphomicrobiales bacterium]|nr:ABC transporter ATP-binding protein [Hyphomicrobiales bacterium]MBV8826273.1 ABC transporter ATP-binding protein [Hyphomicrobiales bacterium]MBV9429712.1 ABC transporter ATP-binding protein [Bradyrhizobiaceae bacterium]
MTWAIEALGLGKQYVRGAAHRRHIMTLRDALAEWARRVGGGTASAGSAVTERFWALNDVSFAVEPGEVVGIIGRNGSGKSTLLKIISQITAPTVGEVRLNGRTGTLLEVGTGFHHELTGRENVFLNGTILGMHRAEIARKFDEIVAFSGVEDFIDTAVKRYSSGMQMRLAFAVAAHLDPEILVVDEVLAVGDAEFQKKCLGKMEDLSRTGRTILFVSHNMNAIDQLCSRVIWINGGAVIEDSHDAYAVTTRYLFGEEGAAALKSEWRPPVDAALDTEYFALRSFRARDDAGKTITRPIRNDEQAVIEIALDVRKTHPGLNFGYSIVNESGVRVYWTLTTDQTREHWPKLECGRVTLTSAVPKRFLNQGLFRLELHAGIHNQVWFSQPGATPYAVFLRIAGGLSDSPYWTTARSGVVAPVVSWSATTD